MKTILLIIALFICFEGHTQDYYADNFAAGTGVTFRCTKMFSHTRSISNVRNKYILKQQVLKNGEQAGPNSYRYIQSKDPNKEKLYRIIKAAFTAEEIANFKRINAWLGIDIIIAPTGEITEVGFSFPENSVFASIKPDTYYQVEQGVKAQISFTLDAKTRDLYPWIPDLLLVEFAEL